jgi:serine/threonine protein kinase
MIEHLRCARIRESDVKFDCHMSGFVYKVQVSGETLIKKEIPGPDTVEEFLYEVNALDRLRHSHSVIQFYGVIVDDFDEKVKGLLISYAERGALIDVIYDGHKALPWDLREKWARQIVQGLSEIHEFGFVQGDFTLSNIVIDRDNNAKIIDINRRGCPVGWEPPEATPLIQGNQRISMYIGTKSDLFQLGMVLWGLAQQDDEPESIQRPLPPLPNEIPVWYRDIVRQCLSHDPRQRIQAVSLLRRFPYVKELSDAYQLHPVTSVSVDSVQGYFDSDFPEIRPHIRTVQPTDSAFDVDQDRPFSHGATSVGDNSTFHAKTYHQRGRSPPSPLPSNSGQYDPASYRQRYARASWSYNSHGNGYAGGPASDIAPDELPERQSLTPQTSREYIGDLNDTPGLSKPLLKEWIEPAMERAAGDEPSLEYKTPQIEDRQQLDERASEGVAIAAEDAKNELPETGLQSLARSPAQTATPNNERQNDETHPETTASEVDPHKQALNTLHDESTASATNISGPKQTLNPHSTIQEGIPAPAPNTAQAAVPGTDIIGRPDMISRLSLQQPSTPTDRYSSALTGVGSAYDEAGPERKVSIDEDLAVPTTISAEVAQSTDV